MRAKNTPFYFLMALIFSGALVGFISLGTSADPFSDMAPVSDNSGSKTELQLDTIRPGNFPYPTAFNFNYSAIGGMNGGTTSAIQADGKFVFVRWNGTSYYRYNNNGPGGGPGALSDSGVYGGTIRDLTYDGTHMFGGAANNTLRRMNPVTMATINQKAIPGAIFRAIAWDPNRKGFWNCDFGGNITCYDTNGVLRGTITTVATGKYGLAFDSSSTADSAFVWVWNQGTGSTTNELYKYHAASGTLKATYIFTLTGASIGIAGGAEVQTINGNTMLYLNYQNQATVGYTLKTGSAPSTGDSTLVILNDSVLAASNAIRKADRDTLMKYLPMLVGKYRVITKDSNTVLPSLTNYSTIILQETAFDAALVRGLSVGQRTAIKTWLATGTAMAKKSLLLIGGDMGYNYDRTGSPFLDTVMTRSFGGYQYLSDNAGGTGFNAVINISSGDSDGLSTTPPGGSYWPDGSRPVSGGVAWNRYQGRGTADSLAGISKVGPTSVVVTMFQDPRYYVGSGGVGGTDFGFKRVLKGALAFIKSNNGTPTGVTPTSSIADKYTLSQNYPNPFNPTTKINFSLPKSGNTTLKVYDMLGKEVMTLVNDFKTAGSYVVEFNASTLSSGTYFYRLESNGFVDTKKMLLIK